MGEIMIDKFSNNSINAFKQSSFTNAMNYRDSSMNKDKLKQQSIKNRVENLKKKIQMKEYSNKLILIEMEKKAQRTERIKMNYEDNLMRQYLHEMFLVKVKLIQSFFRQKKTNESFSFFLKSEKEKLGWNSNH